MGSIKVDHQKSERPLSFFSFSDMDAIKGLIKNRCIIDEYYDISHDYCYNNAGDVSEINTEIIVTFQTLDDYIKKINLSKIEQEFVQYLYQGYPFKYIGEELVLKKKDMDHMLNDIAYRIKSLNDNLYYESLKKCLFRDKIIDNKKS